MANHQKTYKKLRFESITYFIKMAYTLPEFGYEYDSLEPFIDARTMEIHHSKHHKSYVDKLNVALEGHSELEGKSVEKLISDLDSVPGKIKTAVCNHGGGHANHSFFWKILKKDVDCEEDILDAINKEFGSLDEFKEKFKEAALGIFGSGWAWLVVNKEGKLEIVKTQNQDSPVSEGKKPLLCVDVWEHAYYLKHKNKRPDYIETFFKVINWEQVSENFRG